MLLEQERKDIVEYGRQMLESGLTEGTGGNLSIYNRQQGYVAISPSGIDYAQTKIEDIVIMTLDGKIVEGDKKPSSEFDLHRMIYQTKPEVDAVIHTHSKYCVVMSCMNMPLQAVHYVLADAGSHNIPVAPYRTYGTHELAKVVSETIGDAKAVLMANHGMLGCGKNLRSAYGVVKTCEWVAEIQWRCLAIGKPMVLSDEHMQEVLEKFKEYGQEKDEESQGYFG